MMGPMQPTIRALAVHPGTPNSLHGRDIRCPVVDDVPGGTGVLVRVLQVGVDGTDREVIAGEFGTAPPGDDFLIIGHENLGEVVEVGSNVPPAIRPGGLVVSTVRRPGTSIWDRIGLQDFTTDPIAHERGINLLHGYLAELYVEDEAYVVPLPDILAGVGVLLEPLTIAEKGVHQAFEIQRRMQVWQPRRALVTGAGSVGLLATMALRLRGLEVTVYSRRRAGCLNSEVAEALGAAYVSSAEHSLADVTAADGSFDLAFEATGFSPLAFEAAMAIGPNGVLVIASVTGGSKVIQVDASRFNQGFVLGNKVMVGTVNASRRDFEAGVADLTRAEALWPGWLSRLLTTRIDGLGDPEAILRHLEGDDTAIKVYVQVAERTVT
jgi:threonine dehydrogenase-like Zn-dependent dehydrogenase